MKRLIKWLASQPVGDPRREAIFSGKWDGDDKTKPLTMMVVCSLRVSRIGRSDEFLNFIGEGKDHETAIDNAFAVLGRLAGGSQ